MFIRTFLILITAMFMPSLRAMQPDEVSQADAAKKQLNTKLVQAIRVGNRDAVAQHLEAGADIFDPFAYVRQPRAPLAFTNDPMQLIFEKMVTTPIKKTKAGIHTFLLCLKRKSPESATCRTLYSDTIRCVALKAAFLDLLEDVRIDGMSKIDAMFKELNYIIQSSMESDE